MLKKDEQKGRLEYFPLSMYKKEPKDFEDQVFDLRNHVGKVKHKKVRRRDDLPLPDDCLIRTGKDNDTKLVYCVTMYNEPYIQLVQTLAGVYRSYYELCKIDEDFKDKCHIIIITDGYDKLGEDFLKCCENAGIYNEFETKRWRSVEIPPGSNKPVHKMRDLNFINETTMNDKKRIYGTNNIGHTFSRMVKFPDFFNSLPEEDAAEAEVKGYTFYEYTLGDPRRGKIKKKIFYHIPMPVHFCIKHRNQGKIESHKWFFKGFCEYMNPKYAQILDCGSIPMFNSISHIVMHMEDDPQVGGACGEIECIIPEKKEKEKGVSFFESVMLKAQYVEYKLSHYLDKSTETLFGFVSVLPGAFSTFRWECINGVPLQQFLRGANDEFGDITKIRTCASANKYLAEDRIMCLEILAKKNKDFVIHYVPGAICMTDPPMSLTDLMKQRRRWFNGSLFASFYVLKHMCRIWGRSKCSFLRNILLMFLYFYLIIQVLLFFVIVGVFYAIFSIFLRAVLPSSECLSISSAANVIENAYIAFLVIILVLSISVDIKWAENGYRFCSFFMGLFTLLMMGSSIVFALGDSFESLGVIFLAAFFLSYLVPLVLNCRHIRFSHFVTGALYATYLSPTYINILTIYAISNIHDVSWGSRPSESNALLQAVEKKKSILYRNFRANFLIFWIIINCAVAAGILVLARTGDVDIVFYLGAFLLMVMLFKITFSILFYIKAVIDRIRVRLLIRKRKSTVFDEVEKMNDENKEEVFEVYFDHYGAFKRANTKDDPDFKHADFKTSINSQNTFRGFNLAKLTEQHQIQQGIINNFLGRLGTTTFYKEDDNKEDGDHTVKTIDGEDSSLLNSPDAKMSANIRNLFRETAGTGGDKVNFEQAVENMDRDNHEITRMKTKTGKGNKPLSILNFTGAGKKDSKPQEMVMEESMSDSSFTESKNMSSGSVDQSRRSSMTDGPEPESTSQIREDSISDVDSEDESLEQSLYSNDRSKLDQKESDSGL